MARSPSGLPESEKAYEKEVSASASAASAVTPTVSPGAAFSATELSEESSSERVGSNSSTSMTLMVMTAVSDLLPSLARMVMV